MSSTKKRGTKSPVLDSTNLRQRSKGTLPDIGDPPMKPWKAYERQIYEAMAEAIFLDSQVVYGDYLPGRLSQSRRQIDILVRGRFIAKRGVEQLIVVDCKHYSDKVDVMGVEQFLGMMADVGAYRGIMVTSKGFTKAAMNRASADFNASIHVVTYDELRLWRFKGTVSYTQGASTGMVGYLDPDRNWEFVSQIVPAEIAIKLLSRAREREKLQGDARRRREAAPSGINE